MTYCRVTSTFLVLVSAAFCNTVESQQAQEVHTVKLWKRSAPICAPTPGRSSPRSGGPCGGAASQRSYYVGHVIVGKPRVKLSVSFDTTLGQVLFRSDKCRSSTCMEYQRYTAEVSATASDLDKRDVVTVGLAGEGSTAGDLVQEFVCLDTDGGRRPCTSMGIMLMTEMTEAPFRAMPSDGLIGLGLEALSTGPNFHFLGALAPSVPIRPQFGVYFGPTGGEISFGGPNYAHLADDATIAWSPVERPSEGYWQVRLEGVFVNGTSVNVCGEGGCRGIVDTTSAHIGVPAMFYDAIQAALMSRGPEPVRDTDGQGCRGPSLLLKLEGVTLTLRPEDYLSEGDCFPLLESLELPKELSGAFVLGEPVLRRYYTVFDGQVPPRIGFGLAGAAPGDEEQPMAEAMVVETEQAPMSLIDLEVGGLPIGSTILPTLLVVVLGLMIPLLLLNSDVFGKDVAADSTVSAKPWVTMQSTVPRKQPACISSVTSRACYSSSSQMALSQTSPTAPIPPSSARGWCAHDRSAKTSPFLLNSEGARCSSANLGALPAPNTGQASNNLQVKQLETEINARDVKIARLEMEMAKQAEFIAALRMQVGGEETSTNLRMQPRGATEFESISSLVNSNLTARGIYFLISRRWYEAWLQWASQPEVASNGARAVRPGPIDNAELLEASSSLPGGRSNFVAVPPAAWEMFRAWYGGGPPIKRRAVQAENGTVSISFHGLRLYVYRSSDIQGEPLQSVEPSSTTVRELKASVCSELGLDPQKVRVWDFYTKTLFEFLEHSLDKSLANCRILDNSPILLEEQIDDDSWPYADPMQVEGIGFF